MINNATIKQLYMANQLLSFVFLILLLAPAGFCIKEQGLDYTKIDKEIKAEFDKIDLDTKVSDEGELIRLQYEPVLKGLKDRSDIEKVIKKLTLLFSKKDRYIGNAVSLRRRTKDDIEKIHKVLEQYGYYNAQIDYTIESLEEASKSKKSTKDKAENKKKVTIEINKGQQFKINNVKISCDYEHALADAAVQQHQLKSGEPAEMEVLSHNRTVIERALTTKGFPFAIVEEPILIVDHTTQTVDVTYLVTLKQYCLFGPTTISGNEKVKQKYILNRLTWKQGETYNSDKIDDSRKNLIDSGLFSLVRINNSLPANSEAVDMQVELTEDKFRYWGAGASYSTSTKMGGRFILGHNYFNLFGYRGQFEVSYREARVLRGIEALYSIADFVLPNQKLQTNFLYQTEHNPSYTKKSKTFKASLKRQLGENLAGKLGVIIDSGSFIEPTKYSYNVIIFGLPCEWQYNTTNSPLNPVEGFKLDLTATPYIGQNHYSDKDRQLYLLELRVRGVAHFPIDKKKRRIVAVWGEVGTMQGGSRTILPANLRFYAGGNSSVRGYGWQMAEDLTLKDPAPKGGNNIIQTGAEFRQMITNDIGGVLFFDAAQITQPAKPQLSRNWFWGYGIGVRYYTDLGPIRVDVSFPGKRRKKLDKIFQFYVSIGQSL